MNNSKTSLSSSLTGRLFSSGVQAIALQIIGTVFYYFLSVKLSKDDFGNISWGNACSALLVTALSLGLEQIVARRIAAHRDEDWPAAAFLAHATGTTVIALISLAILNALHTSSDLKLLLLFFAVQCFIFMVAPLRQFLNARERFRPYAIISLISNVAKLAFAWWLYSRGDLSITHIAYLLMLTGAFELLTMLLYVWRSANFHFRFSVIQYKDLVRESLPQYLSMLFDIGLARADWVLMGLLSTRAATAEYTFAYRGFEVGRMPLAILAPLLLPRFARAVIAGLDDKKRLHIRQFFVAEMLAICCVPLIACLLWVPVIGGITAGKYGLSNALPFYLLIFGLPAQAAYNYFWNIAFSAQKYRQITGITVLVTLLNIVLNIILIPLYGGVGAAIVYLVTSFLQAMLLWRLATSVAGQMPLRPAMFFYAAAGVGFFIFYQLAATSYLISVLISLAVFLLLIWISRYARGISGQTFRDLLD